jgi:DNA replication and repair protein RecF
VHIARLSLANFRNYPKLELHLSSGVTVLLGDNAQGKTNLLEAIYLLATSRSPRATNERELINWAAFHEDLPMCRLVADAERAATKLRIEIVLSTKTPDSETAAASPATWQRGARGTQTHKRIRLNGVLRRAVDLVGQINVVLFSVHDIDIIGGEPALRRRYLDFTNSQIDAHYLRNLQRYQRVLWQRNRLLRRIAENKAGTDELNFWDQELVRTGSYLVATRQVAIAALEELGQPIHQELTGDEGELSLVYVRSIEGNGGQGESGVEEVAQAFDRALRDNQDRDIAQGMSLVGPHRDDIRFLTDGIDMGVFGSRGQQRTAALSLKLAQASLMLNSTGEHPILLLDDVLSELDGPRRSHLQGSIARYQQVLVSATDAHHFAPGFLEKAQLLRVVQGRIEAVSA